jgi:hypothetical protein
VTAKLLACVTAVIAAAALTLAAMIALVQGTIMAVSIASLPLRFLAVAADIFLGTALLVGCIYLATHLAVRILGVGQADFPPHSGRLQVEPAPVPEDAGQTNPPKN